MGKRLQNISQETRIIRIVRPTQTIVRTVQPLRFLTLTDEEFNLFRDPPGPLNPMVWVVTETGTELPPSPSPPPTGVTTDNVPEGLINKYFLDTRARVATVDNTISPSLIDKAPSQAAVFTALEGKAGTGVNVGTGLGSVFKGKHLVTGNLEFRRILAGAGIFVNEVGDDVEVSSTAGTGGEANTASNRGTAGVGKAEIFALKQGVDLTFKRIAQGPGIAVTQDQNTITIGSATQTAETTLSASQVNNLDVIPINLIAAPGAGFSIIVESVELFLNFNSTAFSGSGDLIVEYNLTAPILNFSTSGFLTAGNSQRRFKLGHTNFDVMLENNLVRIRNAGPLAGGDSPLTAKVRYKTIQVIS